MGEERYLIVYNYKEQEIRIVIDIQCIGGKLSKVLVGGNSVNGELSSENICKHISSEMEICERFITGEGYQRPEQRKFGLFTKYCGFLIDLDVNVDYDSNKIRYMSAGMMIPSRPLSEMLDTIKNGIMDRKRWIDDAHPFREDGDWTYKEPDEQIEERRNVENRMLYPELFPDVDVYPDFLESYSAEKVAELLEAISGDRAAGRSGGKQKSHKIPRPDEKHQS